MTSKTPSATSKQWRLIWNLAVKARQRAPRGPLTDKEADAVIATLKQAVKERKGRTHEMTLS